MPAKAFGALAALVVGTSGISAVVLPATEAHALPSGPATHACEHVMAVEDRLQEMGFDTSVFFEHVVSNLCPL